MVGGVSTRGHQGRIRDINGLGVGDSGFVKDCAWSG